ncbi:hypothetical protein [Streptomyces sp. NPDC094032]|uniref:hypothetical protein n=1 Tax=Streptomyces sp. NPDC094032 TaxID=3155308 RepID=UPI003327D616
MTDIVFNPTFKHVAWVDNRDRVAASGQNGFNVRFDAIQQDLESLSTVVKQVDVGLKAAGARPLLERKLTLAPAFVPVEGDPSWAIDSFGVATKKDGTRPTIRGIMTVTPPDGVVLRRLRVTGRNTSAGSLTVSLQRVPLAESGNLETVVAVSCSGGPFGDPQDVPADRNRVDMSTYRYFIDASADGAPVGTSLVITSIQLSYLGV